MAILSEIDRFIRTATQSAVYGTFSQRFDPSEFERDREDGVTILDLNPDCRVFIGGAELTADIDGVNISSSMDGSRCTINLNNPRGKYEISKMDLMKRWREDKDILSAYTYDELKKQDPLNYDKLAQKVGGAQAGQIVDMTKKLVDTFGGLAQGIPLSRGVTRMLFETKFQSGMTKKAGDIVFDYRDPVIVFMKGRFSPYWYFAFTGIIVSYSDSDAYGESNVLTLNCEDTATIWKRTKMTIKGAFFGMSNLENRILNANTKTKGNPYGDPKTNLTFSNMIKVVAFTYDYGLRTDNCFPESVFPETAKKGGGGAASGAITGALKAGGSSSNPLDVRYKQYLNNLRKGLGIGNTFKLTDNGLVGSVISRLAKQPAGVRSMSKINYNINGYTFTGGPNDKSFSAANSIYFQLNEIRYPAGRFDGATISKFFDLSVRLWECQHDIDEKTVQNDEYNGTGWANTKYFGICGNHPAMKYNFIDNFNILPRIWSLFYKYKEKNVNKLKLTLYDKVYESVIGSPTELIPGGTKMSSIPEGSNLNIFRPRLFVVLPEKYSGTRRLAGEFADLGKLDSDNATNIWDYFKGALKAIEYNFYCSPCGDVYIEPELYDMHPIEFSGQIESRNIIQKSSKLEISNTSSTIGSGNNKVPEQGETTQVKVTHTAYFYNPKANHPFFIMEKDRLRNTHEFSADKIVSAVTVSGGMTKNGGIPESIANNPQTASLRRISTGIAKGNAKTIKDYMKFVEGQYVADGFESLMQNDTARQKFEENANAYTEAYETYRKLVFINLLTKMEVKIRTIIKDFLDSIFTVASKPNLDWNPGVVSSVTTYLRDRGITKKPKGDYEDSIYWYITTNYCKGLLRSLKIEDPAPLPQEIESAILNKSVKDFLFIASNPKQAMGNYDIIYNNILKDVSKKGQQGGTSSEDTVKVLQEYTQAGLFSLDDGSQNKNDVLGNKREVVFNLMMLREPVSLTSDVNAQGMYGIAQDARKKCFLPREMRATTLADLAAMRKTGAYDPRTDLIRLYGFKRGEDISNQYVMNGEEATAYAKAVFNRLLGESQSMNVTFIGRPEMWLNRPYFLERKDCIGLSKQYSINYKYGSDFTSTVLLTYIRKNSLTYAYSIPGLDIIRGSHDNNYFYTQGRLYLQLQAAIQKSATAASNSLNGILAQSIGGTGGQITGEITSGLSKDASSYIKVGGLYVANDFLGHMNYDSRGNSEVAVIDTQNTGDNKSQYYPAYGEDVLSKIAKDIESYLTTKQDLETKITSDTQKEINLKKEIESLNKQLAEESRKNVSEEPKLDPEKIKSLQASILEKTKTRGNTTAALAYNKDKVNSANVALYSQYLLNIYGKTITKDDTLTTAIKGLYKSQSRGTPVDTYGLFYKLFAAHVGYLNIDRNSSKYIGIRLTSKLGEATYGPANIMYFIKDKN